MLAGYRLKSGIGIGIGLILEFVGGLMSTAYGLAPLSRVVYLVVFLIGVGFFIYGCVQYAKGKGYSGQLGAYGILSLIGLIILIRLPDRSGEQDEQEMTSRYASRSLFLGFFAIMPAFTFALMRYSGDSTENSGIAVMFMVFMMLLAIIFGHIGWGEIRRSAGRLKGSATALVGLILGYAGVVLIIAAFAIPPLLKSRIAASQVSALEDLRTINTAALNYNSTYGGFPPSMAALGPASGNKTFDAQAAGLIDNVLASGRKSGYNFTYVPGELDAKGFPHSYTIKVDPVADSGGWDQPHYFSDQTGTIRQDSDKSADINSQVLEYGASQFDDTLRKSQKLLVK